MAKTYTEEEVLALISKAFEFGKESVEYTDEEGYNSRNNLSDCLVEMKEPELLEKHLSRF